MAALFKYLAAVAVIGSAVIAGAIFLGFAAVIETPTTTTPAWKLERLRTEPDTHYIAQGSLSPIYPATPGKELLGVPAQTVVRVAKRLDVSQVLLTHELPRQIYAAVQHDRNYSQQSNGDAEEPQAHPRTFNDLAHDLY